MYTLFCFLPYMHNYMCMTIRNYMYIIFVIFTDSIFRFIVLFPKNVITIIIMITNC